MAPLAVNVCGPVLNAMLVPSLQTNFSAHGAIALILASRGSSIDLNEVTSRPFVWMWYIVALLPFFIACVLSECQPYALGDDHRLHSRSLDALLFTLLNPVATVHMMSYTQRPSPFGAAKPHQLANLLLDCWIDVKNMENGVEIGNQTLNAAVLTRRLVCFITPYYLSSAGCMRELFAALLHRRRLGKAEDGQETVFLFAQHYGKLLEARSAVDPGVSVDWEALERALESAFGKHTVIHDIEGFLHWTDYEDRGGRENILRWYQRHGVQQQLHISVGAGLRALYPTTKMKTGSQPGLKPAPLDPAAPRAGRVTLMSQRLGILSNKDTERSFSCCLSLFNLLFVGVFVFCFLDLIFLWSSSQRGILLQSTAYGLYSSLSALSSGLSLVFCFLVSVQALEWWSIANPKFAYSNYLEPLLMAVHVNDAVQEGPEGREKDALMISINPLRTDTPDSEPRENPGGSSPLVVHFCTVSRQGGYVPAFANNLAVFVEDHVGITVKQCSLPILETKSGIYCFFLDSDDAAEVESWLGGVNSVQPTRRVLAVSAKAFDGTHKSKLLPFMLEVVPSPDAPSPDELKAAKLGTTKEAAKLETAKEAEKRLLEEAEKRMMATTKAAKRILMFVSLRGVSRHCLHAFTYRTPHSTHPLSPCSAIASKVGSALVAGRSREPLISQAASKR